MPNMSFPFQLAALRNISKSTTKQKKKKKIVITTDAVVSEYHSARSTSGSASRRYLQAEKLAAP